MLREVTVLYRTLVLFTVAASIQLTTVLTPVVRDLRSSNLPRDNGRHLHSHRTYNSYRSTLKGLGRGNQ